jgi:hypothetical protein
MDFDDIFAAYYALYRVEAEAPASTDDEYLVAKSLANEAVNRWANYDNTLWKELFTTNLTDGGGESTVSAGTSEYAVSDNFREAGGFVRILDADGNTVRRYRLIEPHEQQFKSDSSFYATFIGDRSQGYTLKLNPVPDDAIDGLSIEYDYYKTPTLFTRGSTVTEMSQPYFIVHRMLANRFRGSRNPYYGSAKNDAEDVLRTMQLENNSGSWSNPWSLPDNSGTTWGA